MPSGVLTVLTVPSRAKTLIDPSRITTMCWIVPSRSTMRKVRRVVCDLPVNMLGDVLHRRPLLQSFNRARHAVDDRLRLRCQSQRSRLLADPVNQVRD